MAGGWQVVQSAKEKKKREGKPKGKDTSGPAALLDPASAALAKFDAEWSKQNGGTEPAQATSGRGAATDGAALASNRGAFGGLEVEASPPSTPRAPGGEGAAANGTGSDRDGQKKATKPKKPKAKKVSTAQVAAELDSAELSALLSSVEQKYKADERNQLEIVADHLLTSFRDVDIPFNKTVLEQPVAKAVDIPLSDVPPEVLSILTAFFARKEARALADVMEKLVAALFAGIPDSNPAKTTPPKAKVGLLVTLAAILCARPEVLLLLAPSLLDHATSYSHPRRLPFQLWVVHQTIRSNVGVAAAVWSRVMLPQILGQQLPPLSGGKPEVERPVPKLGAAGATLAIEYLEELLTVARDGATKIGVQRLGPTTGDAKGLWALKAADTRLLRASQLGIDTQEGGRPEPVVPAAAVHAIARACFVPEPSFGPTIARIRLLRLYEELSELHLAGVASGVASPSEAVRYALDTATIGAENPSEGDELVGQAARCLVELVVVEPSGAAAAWESRHKQQIRGSAAVLGLLQTQQPQYLHPLFQNPHRRGVFLGLLQQLQGRHKSLRQHGKSWQQRSASRAEEACLALASSTRQGMRRAAASNLLLVASFLALLLVFLSRQDFAKEFGARVLATREGQRFAAAVQPAADWLTTHAHAAADVVQPLLAERRQQLEAALGPVAEQLRERIAPIRDNVSAWVAAMIQSSRRES